MAPITLITALPAYISLEEHRNIVASTPASFTDIPPVLRHKEENVSITIDPPVDGLTAADCANGTLHILESVLVFMSTTGHGFQVEYPAITLHAISRAEAGPSIYCQLDQVPSPDEDVPAADDAASELKELIIVPQDGAALEPIFEGLSYCASLHPDPASLSDDMDDAFVDANGFETFTGDESEELSEVGRVRSDFTNNSRYAPY
ncbi:regulator of volume decrease after cellular swelling-domain-containing protein [Amylocystis lapponica]|nr:regulator of volume decrease after cellular swelling-domain-containing protein [Amylocystis lapponica]